MTWFKVDDNLAFHPKVLQAGNAAMGLWVRAGSWSAQQLTDGRVPDSILGSLGTVKQAETLVRVGLWTRGAGAWEFHGWSDEGRQPTKSMVEADRAAARERQRKHREQEGASRSDITGSHTVSNSEVTPLVTAPRPDPARPEEEAKASSPAKKSETRLPADWAPTAAHYERAKASRIDIAAQVEAFRLHAETHDRHAANWNAAFTTWLTKSKPSKAGVDPRDEWKWNR